MSVLQTSATRLGCALTPQQQVSAMMEMLAPPTTNAARVNAKTWPWFLVTMKIHAQRTVATQMRGAPTTPTLWAAVMEAFAPHTTVV